jgi:hypothetical protein
MRHAGRIAPLGTCRDAAIEPILDPNLRTYKHLGNHNRSFICCFNDLLCSGFVTEEFFVDFRNSGYHNSSFIHNSSSRCRDSVSTRNLPLPVELKLGESQE